jgi:hypothetical protein
LAARALIGLFLAGMAGWVLWRHPAIAFCVILAVAAWHRGRAFLAHPFWPWLGRTLRRWWEDQLAYEPFRYRRR